MSDVRHNCKSLNRYISSSRIIVRLWRNLVPTARLELDDSLLTKHRTFLKFKMSDLHWLKVVFGHKSAADCSISVKFCVGGSFSQNVGRPNLGGIDDLCKLGKEYLTALTCKLYVSFQTKFWNFWHITRLSIISHCKVKKKKKLSDQKQSGFFGPRCSLGFGERRLSYRLRYTCYIFTTGGFCDAVGVFRWQADSGWLLGRVVRSMSHNGTCIWC